MQHSITKRPLVCPRLIQWAYRSLLLWIGGVAAGQETVRASVDSAGNEVNYYSQYPSISGDGRVVAFQSPSDELVPGDSNSNFDVFLHDLAARTTELISVDSSGVQGNSGSGGASVSQDGRLVAFHSVADNLVRKDANGAYDVFLRDRASGTTTRLSESATHGEGDDDSFTPRISGDGSVVAFSSEASNLVPGDKNFDFDVFVKDVRSGAITRVSVSSAGKEGDDDSFVAAISHDGNFVAFVSRATNLVTGDKNGHADVFVHDRSTGATQRVSLAEDGSEGNEDAYDAAISDDGTIVAFTSAASNLVRGDSNGGVDVFVADLKRDTLERANVGVAGKQSDGHASSLALSATGRYVGFEDNGSNLVPGDTNVAADVFVRDRHHGVTWRASVATDGSEGNDQSGDLAMDDSGLAISFESAASNLVRGDLNFWEDIMVRTEVAASWSSYGVGHPGTLGVPTLTAPEAPVVGGRFDVDLGNSAGIDTTALLFLGYAEADLPTGAGGSLLVDIALTIPLGLPAAGLRLGAVLPEDPALDGFVIYLQALELDDGASDGLSFSPGLEAQLGR